MREIKFRGYDDEREEWRIGGLDRDLEQKRYYITNEYEGIGREVLQRTIGQYTGLHDKNGKEIYENMIINNEYIVVYDFCKFVLKNIKNGNITDFKKDGVYEITREYFE